MATITGQRSTTNVASQQLALDLGREIHLLEPNLQVLTAFSRDAETRRTVATKFKWYTDASEPRFDTTSAGVAGTTAVVIPVTHGAYWAQHDLMKNTRTGEVLLVVSVSANNVTVAARGTVNTAAAMNSGDELVRLGSAQPEGDTSKPARSSNLTEVLNYTQITRNPFEASDSLRASGSQLNPRDWNHQQRKMAIEHGKDLEYVNLAGVKALDTSGSTERRFAGGIIPAITTNQTDAGGDLTEAEFNGFMAQQGRYSSVNKLALASATAIGALNKFPANKQMTTNNDKTYGMDVTHYTSHFGSLNVVWHRLLEGTKYGGYLVTVDMDEVAWRPLANDELNRDTHIKPNIQPNDQDGRKDELITEGAIEWGEEKKHAILTGITS